MLGVAVDARAFGEAKNLVIRGADFSVKNVIFAEARLARLLYHNHRTFYNDHLASRVVKSEARVPWMTLSILLPWLLGLLQVFILLML